MGCILASRQITIYYKDDYPECINLTYDFDKALIGPDMQPTHLKTFDDNEQLKPSKSFHIERIIIYYN